MSLAIDVDRIGRVLLTDGWHDIETGSFGTDSYEFGEYVQRGSDREFYPEHRGGDSGLCATGFTFCDAHTGRAICGPLTAVLAVEYGEKR